MSPEPQRFSNGAQLPLVEPGAGQWNCDGASARGLKNRDIGLGEGLRTSEKGAP